LDKPGDQLEATDDDERENQKSIISAPGEAGAVQPVKVRPG
jgi:hypothetical protein